MNAEIIAVGTELLLGQIVNTNAAFLSQELATLGINVYHHVVVGDNAKRLKETIEYAEQRSDLIILIGGLGPTKDDLTKQVLAEHLGKDLVVDPATMKNIIDFYERSKRPMTQNNQLQALVIEGSTVLKNVNGLRTGMFFKQNEQFYLLLHGPPHELKKMFRQEAEPLLLAYTNQKNALVSRVLRFIGIGESQLAAQLDDLIVNQINPTVASYAGKYEVSIRLTASGGTEKECRSFLDNMEAESKKRVGSYLYG